MKWGLDMFGCAISSRDGKCSSHLSIHRSHTLHLHLFSHSTVHAPSNSLSIHSSHPLYLFPSTSRRRASRALDVVRALVDSDRPIEYSAHTSALLTLSSIRARMLASPQAPECSQGTPARPSALDKLLSASARAFPGSEALLSSLADAPDSMTPRSRLVWPAVLDAIAKGEGPEGALAGKVWEAIKARLDVVIEDGGSLGRANVEDSAG